MHCDRFYNRSGFKMKLLAVICALILSFHDAASEKGKDCYVAAVCSSSQNSKPLWMQYSPPTCESNKMSNGTEDWKGERGEVGPKGKNGTQGKIGPHGPKGENGTKGEKGEKGELGPVGENGTKGDLGPKGELGSVDTLIIKNIVDVICRVKHDNKCFLPLIGRDVDHAEGVKLCQQFGGNLANIYDQTHMDKVMSYIRNHTLGNFTVMKFHLGMTYDLTSNTTMNRDGSAAAAGLKWAAGHPLNTANRTSMYLTVQSNSTSALQYLFNDIPTRKRNILCQTP